MYLYVFFGITCQNILQGSTRFCEIVPFKEKERAELVGHWGGSARAPKGGLRWACCCGNLSRREVLCPSFSHLIRTLLRFETKLQVTL